MTTSTGKLIQKLITNQSTFQLYKEHETEDDGAIEKIIAARKSDGMFNRSSMTHNFACDYNKSSNYARSQANRHSEPMVAGIFLAGRGKKGQLNIVTERQPCSYCEDDLKKLEKAADPDLTIEAYYFIPYGKGEGKEPLVEFYEEKKKI